MANRKTSDLTALTAPAVGDLLPIVDISEAAAADKNKRITLGTLLGGAPLGTAAAPSIAFTGDSNTGIYSPGADQLAIATAGTGRVFVDGSGNLGLEVTPSAWSTGKALEFTSGAWYSSSASIQDLCHNTYFNGTYYYKNTNGAVIYRQSGSQHAWFNAPSGTANTVAPFTQAMTLDASGRLGIGGTSPAYALDVRTTGTSISSSFTSDQSEQYIALKDSGTTLGHVRLGSTSGSMLFFAGNGERARIDSSGRLLVGTSTDIGGALLQVNGDRIRVGTAKTPASASATGAAGEICWDANYIYVCTATNTWKRTAIATW